MNISLHNKISDLTIVLVIGIVLMGSIMFVWSRLFEATITMYEGPRVALYIQPKPNVSWATYKDPDLEYTIKYPDTYSTIPVLEEEARDIAYKTIDFSPPSTSGVLNSIRLSMYSPTGIKDLLEWLKINTTPLTPDSAISQGRTFVLYGVSTPSASTVSNKSVFKMAAVTPFTNTPIEVTAFMSDQFIYFISRTQDQNGFIYQQMLSSFRY